MSITSKPHSVSTKHQPRVMAHAHYPSTQKAVAGPPPVPKPVSELRVSKNSNSHMKSLFILGRVQGSPVPKPVIIYLVSESQQVMCTPRLDLTPCLDV